MSAIPQPRYSFEEYLARERVAEERSEFYRGQIFAMAGGSPRHNTICLSIASALKSRLRGGPCRPFASDQRLRIPTNGLSTYPDISVVCGELKFNEIDHDAIVNPKVLVEVLSPSTESYNRGKKFDLYRELPSLQEYILVSQDEALVERFVRQDDGDWLLTVFKGMNSVLELGTIACHLSFAEIYEDISFGPDETQLNITN
ncbi:Uma2 family endonuclease [Anatilimnocola floriformis]|uniref:Uma2 family endonuclease n=1 Tax=Anatilimnocola floriformis TaxID=2948575 RepID=UPI0020C378E8|nr:Uma2 family endonuclease [Anatilimnocola floriformis]